MKSVIASVVLALCVAFVASQSASTNPAGATYFFPASTLALNSSVSSIIYNSTVSNYYAEFYKVWVPASVYGVTYTVSNNATYYNYLYVTWIFPENEFDSTVGYSCGSSSGDSYGSPCDSYDAYDSLYYSSSYSYEFTAEDDFIPGRWQFISITSTTYGNYTPYTLSVVATSYCATNTSIVGADDGDYTCIASTAVTNVTTQGASYSGTFAASANDYDVYVIDVPANVSRVWAWVASDYSYPFVSASAGYAGLSIYSNDVYENSYDGYNSTTQLYYTYLEYSSPLYNQPLYFVVGQYYSTGYSYSVQFGWSGCGATKAGYGSISNDYYNGNTTFTQPDCQYDVTTAVNLLTSAHTINFAVGAYNSSSDSSTGEHATYASVYVPSGTVGALNFTCNSTSSSTSIVISKNNLVTCDDYTWYLYCTGNGYTTTDYFSLLSEDLFPGGWWSIAACNDDDAAISASLVPTGTVSAAPSASPSSGSDESSSSLVVPALLFSVVAAVLSF